MFDENILGSDVNFPPNGKGSYFIGDAKRTLMYAFYDFNGSGIPELLIGANLQGDSGVPDGTNVFVTGIYVLQNGNPVSLIQVGAWSHFTFSTDSDGNCFIKKIFGTHIDSFFENFYKIDKDGTLIVLDEQYTFFDYDFYGYDNLNDIPYSHKKDANPENGEGVSITEQEYFDLMQKYSSVGNQDFTCDFEDNEITINSWKPLAAYE